MEEQVRILALSFPSYVTGYAFASLSPKSSNSRRVLKVGLKKLVSLTSSVGGQTGVINVRFRAYNGLKKNNVHAPEPRGQVAEPRLYPGWSPG